MIESSLCFLEQIDGAETGLYCIGAVITTPRWAGMPRLIRLAWRGINLYSYVGGDPGNLYDPTRDAVSLIFGAIGGGRGSK